MSKFIPYNPNLKPLANKLRKNMTPGEILLWKEFKLDHFWGIDFDRQKCIDNYIVDFYNKELMLAIEIDGISHHHEEAFIKDEKRQSKLESFGIKFLRFTEAEVKHDMPNVLRSIEWMIITIVKEDSSIKLPDNFDRSLLD